MRLRFWLLAMDVIAASGGFGSRLYLYAVGRAGALTDWGHGQPGKDEPW